MSDVLLEGTVAAKAALDAGHRPVYELLLREGGKPRRGDSALIAAAKRIGVKVSYVSGDEISAIAAGRTHGGVLLRAGPRKWQEIEDIAPANAPLLFCLEGVEDPYNLGQAIRALWAAGVGGTLLPPRDWITAEATIARASAGAWDYMPLIELNEGNILDIVRRGVRIICAEGTPGIKTLYGADLKGAVLIAVGGEKRGISRFVLDRAYARVRIPYGRMYAQSLPTTAAASILAYEALRQRAYASD